MAQKAKAPNVRANERRHESEKRTDGSDQSIKIRYKGKRLELSILDLGPGDDEVARQQCGEAITGLFFAVAQGGSVGLDTFAKMLWFARRKNGEPDLTWQEMTQQFPTYRDLLKALGDLATALTLDTGDGDEDPKDDL